MAEPSRGEWVTDGCKMVNLVGGDACVSLLKARLVGEYIVLWKGEDSGRESHCSFAERYDGSKYLSGSNAESRGNLKLPLSCDPWLEEQPGAQSATVATARDHNGAIGGAAHAPHDPLDQDQHPGAVHKRDDDSHDGDCAQRTRPCQRCQSTDILIALRNQPSAAYNSNAS